jgi:hypothetical protein
MLFYELVVMGGVGNVSRMGRGSRLTSRGKGVAYKTPAGIANRCICSDSHARSDDGRDVFSLQVAIVYKRIKLKPPPGPTRRRVFAHAHVTNPPLARKRYARPESHTIARITSLLDDWDGALRAAAANKRKGTLAGTGHRRRSPGGAGPRPSLTHHTGTSMQWHSCSCTSCPLATALSSARGAAPLIRPLQGIWSAPRSPRLSLVPVLGNPAADFGQPQRCSMVVPCYATGAPAGVPRWRPTSP